ncbi:MAG: hypothetical protein BHV93_03200 [Clostridiales bacterium 52_15]|nr:MAG: hypothetical protein BHV93_03200 [Clostridiales bacterium 52_15]
MNNFQRITASREALATFLGTIQAIETPWDDAFHRIYCSSCSAADCDDCRRPERDNPLWWLRPPAAGGGERKPDFSIPSLRSRGRKILSPIGASLPEDARGASLA